MNCAICESPIPPARLLAVPTTRLCIECKRLNDEEPLGSHSPRLAGCMAANSLSDADEMRREVSELAGRG